MEITCKSECLEHFKTEYCLIACFPGSDECPCRECLINVCCNSVCLIRQMFAYTLIDRTWAWEV
jgi:hypothetical protein